jgi:hypothetical protein
VSDTGGEIGQILRKVGFLEAGGQPFWEEQVGKKERDMGEGFGN